MDLYDKFCLPVQPSHCCFYQDKQVHVVYSEHKHHSVQVHTAWCVINCEGFVCVQHTTTVNQISIDDRGEYLASCSDDGKVCL